MSLLRQSKWSFLLLIILALFAAACGPAQERTGSMPTRMPSGSEPGFVAPDAPLGDSGSKEEPRSAGSITVAEGSELDANGVPVGYTEDGRPYRGSPDAPVVMQEFSDYQCPFCARFKSQTMPTLEEEQIAAGEMMLIFYDFPLTTIHAQAVPAAVAARCAGEQGAAAFWSMHDRIFESPDDWSNAGAVSVFAGYAADLGLDGALFEECQESDRYLADIEADQAYGRSLGVGSTPSFFLNEQPLVGAQPLSVFNQAIAAVKSGAAIAREEPTAQPAAIPTPAVIGLEDAAGAMGGPDAPITIIEYTDYQCPYCQRHSVETMPQIISTLVNSGRVRYVVKDFPLDRIHAEARDAATAARCAGEQDAYWEMHDAIFEGQSDWSGQGAAAAGILQEMATDLGLDESAYQTCVESGRYDAAIQDNLEEGASLGVTGTPFFFIAGFPINGAQPPELFEYAVGLAEEGKLAEAYAPVEEPTPEPTQPSEPVDVPTTGSPSLGDPEAPVTIVEYTDFQCPYCSRHFLQTMPLLRSEYIDTGLVRYVFKDFPLTQIHAQAVAAAEAARCAGDQGAYVEMHDAIFSSQGRWSDNPAAAQIFADFAADLGLDESSFIQCLESGKYTDAVEADFNEGAALGVRGTPAFFINGRFLSGAQPFDIFQRVIEGLLAEGE